MNDSGCFVFLSASGVVTTFNFSHSGRCVVLSRCFLLCIFLMANDIEWFALETDRDHSVGELLELKQGCEGPFGSSRR